MKDVLLAAAVTTYLFTGYSFLSALDKVVPDRAPSGLAQRMAVVVLWPRILVSMHVRHMLGQHEPAGIRPWQGGV